MAKKIKDGVTILKIPEILQEIIKDEITDATPEPVNIPREYQWRKLGHGSFILRGRYIKMNQIFTATEEEIPLGFRDVVILLDKIPFIPTDKKKNPEYTAKNRPGTRLWDIIDSRGKQINEKPVSQEEAEELLTVL
jgi:hypothetical protein